MNSGYTKLFADIITSTIWQEPNDCRVLWITILALKDEANICRATLPALAKMCNLSNDQCEAYLAKFQQPDKYSRSQEFEGRRIEPTEGGWLVLNGQKYRDMLRGQERRDYIRKKVQEHRARTHVNKSKLGNQSKPISEAEAEAKRKGKGCGISIPHSVGSGFKKGPKYSYPTSEEEMYRLLEEADIEPNPDRDGHFYDQMATNGWTINGEKVWDWKATYEARVQNSEDSCKRK
jgi:hypothetical protein